MKPLVLALATLLFATPALAGTPVNINTADANALAQALDGVGLAKAQAIIAWREANGDFDSADQLTSVKGIGQSLVDRNRESILVDGAKPAKKARPSRPAKARGADAED
ncbi:MAG TPA: helix-hairpin-helix domain-containing protein [Luteibacter sp.]|uniref:ComEA family DNA-binding protein n=1 Tax=Luteibacter sp. TaxID=1886636 RepID=UPI002C6A8FFC|nr:helix-hairpin-helix domain-containing protein [Luteibacter sp.]HVI54337.1 helix-hairpin-helix domain-containing protein [Luteibacter sp.]